MSKYRELVRCGGNVLLAAATIKVPGMPMATHSALAVLDHAVTVEDRR